MNGRIMEGISRDMRAHSENAVPLNGVGSKNFPMNPTCWLVGRMVWHNFFKRLGSYTPMLLSAPWIKHVDCACKDKTIACTYDADNE